MKYSFIAATLLSTSSLLHAAFDPIDDAELGVISGQSGITIE